MKWAALIVFWLGEVAPFELDGLCKGHAQSRSQGVDGDRSRVVQAARRQTAAPGSTVHRVADARASEFRERPNVGEMARSRSVAAVADRLLTLHCRPLATGRRLQTGSGNYNGASSAPLSKKGGHPLGGRLNRWEYVAVSALGWELFRNESYAKRSSS